MMVTFISQCQKNALKKTRRVLDAFANRIGDNTWQTTITQEGLDAVKKLLRKTASKNTAVSCFWLRSRSRSELVWVVGNRNKFSKEGHVPVNKTRRVLLGNEWETGWTLATSIQIISTLAALFHDLGKATCGFQKKLHPEGGRRTQGAADPYRHEWISLRLFEAMIADCDTDRKWLERLNDFSGFSDNNPDWTKSIHNDSREKSQGIGDFPPLAKIIAWLIVTHHRLPFAAQVNFSESNRVDLRKNPKFLNLELSRFYKRLAPVDGWVLSPKACKDRKYASEFWEFSAQASDSKPWQSALTRWTKKALEHGPLHGSLCETRLDSPLLMHLSRLCLMVGDHNYSSLAADDKRRVTGDKTLQGKLIANTCRKSREPKQHLDEHLLGVAQFTAEFSRLLPRLYDELPRLDKTHAFARRTAVKRFEWQNKAWSLVKKHHNEARQQGFFGVNLASTGSGKTLGNARIMAGLADPDTGPRFTIALGLRVLTLQTGEALREKLNLDETALATLVGGVASRTLFELGQEELEQKERERDCGSESEERLITDHVDYDHCALDQDTLGTIIHDPKARALLYAPIVSCTVDHIISATETLRGGRHIAPMLRLLTSDLVLDEPDDFDQNDLPALTRLVHMAGMLGSHVLLSSATLTPDLTKGLFTAYREGRKHWLGNLGEKGQGIYCAWFDEFHQRMESCNDEEAFDKEHKKFIEKRAQKLQEQPVRRKGDFLPTPWLQAPEGENINNADLAGRLVEASYTLHKEHHECCPDSGKTLSTGLIRMANINPMHALATALYTTKLPNQVLIHLCCYHARQLLLLRNQLEKKLDRILNRNHDKSLLDHREVRDAIRGSNKKHHIFIVLATAVAEVGRDHDYDWAIIEPSSMRSFIQLVGRVWRHRPEKVADTPNVLIWDKNIKALQAGSNAEVGQAVFNQPGFESKEFLLKSHACSELIPQHQLDNINAIPRICRPEDRDFKPKERLADLEHAVMADLLTPSAVNFVTVYWRPQTAMQANIHLQRASPFRHSANKEEEFVAVPDEACPGEMRFRYSENAWEDPQGEGGSVNSIIAYTDFVPEQSDILPWLVTDLPTALKDLSQKLDAEDIPRLAVRFATVRLEGDKRWCFHPWFGFWQK